MANEFELIDHCFLPLSAGLAESEIGIGDDGAVIDVPENHQMVVVTDTLVSGVHFPENCLAYDIAWKALAVNLSDLAAMGARPGVFSLALTLPNNDQAWLESFSAGLKDISQKYQIPLVGGDTTKGPLTISVTAQGWVEKGQAVLRSGASVGDVICVTNTIGDGAVGLKLALATLTESEQKLLSVEDKDFLLAALNRPQPQLAMITLLKEYASSAIDISDGLLADLSHILIMSKKKSEQELAAKVELSQIPLSVATQQYLQQSQDWSAIITGGDDYQLCFTVPQARLNIFKVEAEKQGLAVTEIGLIEVGKGIQLLNKGVEFSLQQQDGYLHF